MITSGIAIIDNRHVSSDCDAIFRNVYIASAYSNNVAVDIDLMKCSPLIIEFV